MLGFSPLASAPLADDGLKLPGIVLASASISAATTRPVRLSPSLRSARKTKLPTAASSTTQLPNRKRGAAIVAPHPNPAEPAMKEVIVNVCGRAHTDGG